MLLDQSEEQLQRFVTEPNRVRKRRNLTMNGGYSRELVFERDTNTQCRLTMDEQVMENVGQVRRRHTE